MSHIAQCLIITVGDIDKSGAIPDLDTAPRHFVETVGGPQQCRFTGTGQPHEHADLTTSDLKVGIRHTDSHTQFSGDLFACAALIQTFDCLGNRT